MQIDPDRDIVLERVLAAPPALVWRCWAEPALFSQWYLPKPWIALNPVLELRAGGRFAFQVTGLEGAGPAAEGSFLEIVPERKLVFTDLMGADFAPFDQPDTSFGPNFTAVLRFTPEGNGTRYVSVARHRSPQDARTNRQTGFVEGSAIAADQLEALACSLRSYSAP